MDVSFAILCTVSRQPGEPIKLYFSETLSLRTNNDREIWEKFERFRGGSLHTSPLPSQGILATALTILFIRPSFLLSRRSLGSNSSSSSPTSMCITSSSSTISLVQDSVSAIEVDESESLSIGRFFILAHTFLRALTTKGEINDSLLEDDSFTNGWLNI